GIALCGEAVGDISNDMRMIELREHPNLAAEPRLALGALVQQDLHGHRPARLAIERAVDLAHTPGACALFDLESFRQDLSAAHEAGAYLRSTGDRKTRTTPRAPGQLTRTICTAPAPAPRSPPGSSTSHARAHCLDC